MTRRVAPVTGLVIAAGVLLGGACSLAFQPPSVRVAEVRLAAMAVSGGTLAVRVEVDNPNRYALESRGFRYTLAFADSTTDGPSWATLAEGQLADTVRFPAHGTGVAEIAVPFEFASVRAALGRLLGQGGLEYRFRGELLAGTPIGLKRVPFDQRGLFRP